MKAHLIIPVKYKGEILEFKGKLLKGEYGFNIMVKVNGFYILFEPDEKGNCSVKVKVSAKEEKKEVDEMLLTEITRIIHEATKQMEKNVKKDSVVKVAKCYQ